MKKIIIIPNSLLNLKYQTFKIIKYYKNLKYKVQKIQMFQ